MKELLVDAAVENIDAVTNFVNEQLAVYHCPKKTRAQIDIAVDELFGNIAQYAYHPDVGPVTVRVEVTENPLAIRITFIDRGVPYDPLKRENPDVGLPMEQRAEGGLGVYIVKKTMDAICYEYKDGQNILRIKKKF